ncbi:hypothetical protein LPB140_07350 [Sphingorhabdus lutea]|uniref:Lipoprotein n=1 Tax=Sphingorhabdus lutea TaxID=1913578 RepID=A0A1L3JC44_9SPHN|nr:hypothetical protein [Sphingorhabdus lutea]APG62633.1 hypothetical protein LPB140_07350 [Sphingorhabdus lutea]
MRIFNHASLYFLFAAAFMLHGCSEQADNSPFQEETASADNKIMCALNGTDKFEKICVRENIVEKGQTIVTLKHPDGGFKRFIIVKGRGLIAAEGFDNSEIEILDGSQILLRSGNDQYKLDAIVNRKAADDILDGQVNIMTSEAQK